MKKSTRAPSKTTAAPRAADPIAIRELAFQIAREGEDVAALGRSPNDVAAAKKYLVRVAETDGKIALGKNLILVERALAEAIANGDVKNELAALKLHAEILQLRDFVNADSSAQAEADERDEIVRGYLESTGVCRKGLKLEVLARLVAQYVADRILPEETRKETTAKTENEPNGDPTERDA